MGHKKRNNTPPHLQRARPHVIAKVFGDNARLLGREREEAVIEALTPSDDFASPEWLRSVVHGTHEEDARGIDVVIHTDIGKIFLQVKGSGRRMERFLAAHPKGNIVPFLFDRRDDLPALRSRLIGCISDEYRRILALRSA